MIQWFGSGKFLILNLRRDRFSGFPENVYFYFPVLLTNQIRDGELFLSTLSIYQSDGAVKGEGLFRGIADLKMMISCFRAATVLTGLETCQPDEADRNQNDQSPVFH